MTFPGWLLMLGSLGGVLGLCGFCYWKVLTAPAESGDATKEPSPDGASDPAQRSDDLHSPS